MKVETVPQSVYDIRLYTKKPREGAVTPLRLPWIRQCFNMIYLQKKVAIVFRRILMTKFTDKVANMMSISVEPVWLVHIYLLSYA